MPHQCTDCARVFDDGSKEMLSGCPDCGGNKFQFHADATTVTEDVTADQPEPPERPGEGSVAQKVGSAATTVRDLVGTSSSGPPDSSPSDQPSPAASEPSGPATTTEPSDATVTSGDAASGSSPEAAATTAEDAAQASARSELVSPDELPPAPERTHSARPRPVMDDRTDPPESERPREDRPALSELRAELNDQFESIKVLEPGQYELNLMSLYDREEYIIALQEDGKYTIQVPERWEDD